MARRRHYTTTVTVNTEVDVDVTEVLEELEAEDLQALGFFQLERDRWEAIARAVRMNDINEALRLTADLAWDQASVTFPALPTITPAAPVKELA